VSAMALPPVPADQMRRTGGPGATRDRRCRTRAIFTKLTAFSSGHAFRKLPLRRKLKNLFRPPPIRNIRIYSL
jgi:hypothetical protein